MKIVRRRLRNATLGDYLLMYLMAFGFGATAAVLLIVYGTGRSYGVVPVPDSNSEWRSVGETLLWLVAGSGIAGMIYLTVELISMKREDRIMSADSARIEADVERAQAGIVSANQNGISDKADNS